MHESTYKAALAKGETRFGLKETVGEYFLNEMRIEEHLELLELFNSFSRRLACLSIEKPGLVHEIARESLGGIYERPSDYKRFIGVNLGIGAGVLKWKRVDDMLNGFDFEDVDEELFLLQDEILGNDLYLGICKNLDKLDFESYTKEIQYKRDIKALYTRYHKDDIIGVNYFVTHMEPLEHITYLTEVHDLISDIADYIKEEDLIKIVRHNLPEDFRHMSRTILIYMKSSFNHLMTDAKITRIWVLLDIFDKLRILEEDLQSRLDGIIETVAYIDIKRLLLNKGV